jgi:hypothetical protein
MSSPSSLRTVISARAVMKAASSLVASLTRLGIQPCPVRVQEQVGLVAVKLRALMLLHGVLDGQRVQPELLAQHGQVAVVGSLRSSQMVTASSAR